MGAVPRLVCKRIGGVVDMEGRGGSLGWSGGCGEYSVKVKAVCIPC